MGREKVFRFKQFCVHNSLSAMKIGTDGVLLGAWCEVKDAHKILDVGTGTGLVSLMLAQKSYAQIDAIDIEDNAIEEAKKNFDESKWANRLNVDKTDFNSFNLDPKYRYDLIVSNPPYFENSLHSPSAKRSLARHADTLSLEILIKNSSKILNECGRLVIVYPATCIGDIRKFASLNAMGVVKICWVSSNPGAEPKRVLVEIKKGFNLT